MARSSRRPVDYDRLIDSIQACRQAWQTFREERNFAIRQYAGDHWGADQPAADARRISNLLSLYAKVVVRQLVAKVPRFSLSTFAKEARRDVDVAENWVNDEIEVARLDDVLQRAVYDGIFLMGIVKVALATPSESVGSGWGLKVGKPFARVVSFDDFVADRNARSLDEAGFVGHRYRVPLDAAEDQYKPKYKLTPSVDMPETEQGDDRSKQLGQGQEAAMGRLEWQDMVDLWEIYIPSRGIVVTFASDESGQPMKDVEPLDVQEWIGPPCGPYHFLGYGLVPDNAIPKPPVSDLIEPDELANKLMRKLANQAERQKDLTIANRKTEEDGKRIMDAMDGQMVGVDNVDAVKPLSFPGPNPQNFAFATQMWDLFSRQAGNLETMGGLSPQAKTAAQEKMLNANASRIMQDMQDVTVKFVGGVGEALLWYYWHHPDLEMTDHFSPPDTPHVGIDRVVTPEARVRVPWEKLRLRVSPYSLQPVTPQQKGEQIDQFVMNIVMPMTPVMAQQGVFFDLAAYVALRAKLFGTPELLQILTVSDPVTPQGGDQGGDLPQPGGDSTTTHVRENTSEATRMGQDKQLVAEMMAQQPEAPGGLQ
ncbi:MAG TPA: hypothetical protein VM529_24915 [Gemmata sp.]|jgi:hypothetical protein|nr:hypothetical protein [Gemmata sp.]